MSDHENGASPVTPADSPRRKWFRFSLRSLLVIAVLACLFAAWQGNRYRRQQELDRLIIAVNGKGHHLSADKFLFGQPLDSLPRWMRFLRFIASDEVSAIEMRDEWGDNPEETLATARIAHSVRIVGLQHLDRITLSKCLGTRSTTLDIWDTKLSPDALAGVSQFQTVREIHVSGEVLELPSLQGLAEHPSLVVIHFQGKVDDLLKIQSMRSRMTLRDLTLKVVASDYDEGRNETEVPAPAIGVEHLRFLEECRDLERLVIESAVKNEVVSWIVTHFPKLESVTLADSDIADESVQNLLQLSDLKYASLYSCRLSREARQALKSFHRSH